MENLNDALNTDPYSTRNPVPWWEAILVVFLTFFMLGIVGAIVWLTLGEAIALVVGELVILFVPLVYLISKRVNVKSYIRFNFKLKYILIGIGCALLLLLLNIVSSEILTSIFGPSEAVQQTNETIAELSASPLGLIAVALSLSLAGICEEFALRGLLQNSINRSLRQYAVAPLYSFLIAVFFSALVFGFFHFDPQLVYILAAFFSGLALGAIYYRWGYTASATAHSVMNVIVLIFLIFGI